MILAIETSSPVCGVSLHDSKTCLAEKILHEPRVHAEKLVGLTDELLKSQSVDLSKVEAIVVSSGPGSFTGLRIGMSFAKGLAFPSHIPLAGANTLKSFMFFLKDATPQDMKRIFIIRSHRDFIYWAEFNESIDSIKIRYGTIADLAKEYTDPSNCFISNEDISSEQLTGHIIVHPLTPNMVGHYYLESGYSKSTTTYEDIHLQYGMDYKPKVWKQELT